MDLQFHKHFKKKYTLLTPQEQVRCDKRLAMFCDDPYNIVLHNHRLLGAYKGYRSINITGDIRAIYEQVDDVAFFILIGTHSDLYKK